MSKIKTNQITSRAHKGTLVIGDTKDKVQFHHEAEVFIPGYATQDYVDDVADNVMPHENPVFHLNDTELRVDYQIPSGKNAGTFGPLENHANVNVPDGSTWTIVGQDDEPGQTSGTLRGLDDTEIPMVPNDESYLHYDSYKDKWVPKTVSGLNGSDGNDGKSAYEVAVENGFLGTEEEWLASLKGDQGDAFTYDDFTQDQLDALKGDQGDNGEDGDDGLSAYEIAVKNGYGGTEAQWLDSLKGENGEDGDDGKDFTYDDFTPEQLAGLKGDKGEDGKDFTYDDFTSDQLDALKGDAGERGDDGDNGEDGKGWKADGTGYNAATGVVTFASDDGLAFSTGDLRGDDGAPGTGIDVKGSVDSEINLPGGATPGDAYMTSDTGHLWVWGEDGLWHDLGKVVGPEGPQGLSAYEVWEQSNPGGTELEYFEAIKGEKGDDGADFTYDDFTPEQLAALKGEQGESGDDGKSAYELAAEGGFTGTEAEWIASLKGDKGDDGDDGDSFTYDDFTPEQLASLKGDQGDTGANSFEFWLQSNPGGTEEQYWESLKGDQGEKGDPFEYSDFSQDQLDGLKGDQGETGEGQTVAVANVTTVPNKSDGTHGDAAVTENPMTNESRLVLDFAIPAGSQGDEGLPGPSGDSAYTVAVNNGFLGTEAEWLESLKGEDGSDADLPEYDDTKAGYALTVNDLGDGVEWSEIESGGGGDLPDGLEVSNNAVAKMEVKGATAIHWPAKVATDGKIVVAIGSIDGATAAGDQGYVYVSKDGGFSWEEVNDVPASITGGRTEPYDSVTYAGGYFWIKNYYNSLLLKSVDGFKWTAYHTDTTSNEHHFKISGHKFGSAFYTQELNGSHDRYKTSYFNGFSWERTTLPNDTHGDPIGILHEKMVANNLERLNVGVGMTHPNYEELYCITSGDGITWSKQRATQLESIVGGCGNVHGFAYLLGVYIALAKDGRVFKADSSPTSNWTEVYSLGGERKLSEVKLDVFGRKFTITDAKDRKIHTSSDGLDWGATPIGNEFIFEAADQIALCDNEHQAVGPLNREEGQIERFGVQFLDDKPRLTVDGEPVAYVSDLSKIDIDGVNSVATTQYFPDFKRDPIDPSDPLPEKLRESYYSYDLIAFEIDPVATPKFTIAPHILAFDFDNPAIPVNIMLEFKPPESADFGTIATLCIAKMETLPWHLKISDTQSKGKPDGSVYRGGKKYSWSGKNATEWQMVSHLPYDSIEKYTIIQFMAVPNMTACPGEAWECISGLCPGVWQQISGPELFETDKEAD